MGADQARNSEQGDVFLAFFARMLERRFRKMSTFDCTLLPMSGISLRIFD
jgi:hypothetical protein